MSKEITTQAQRPELVKQGNWIVPTVDIFENEQGLLLHADLPGVNQDALVVHLDDDQLTIEGRRAVQGKADAPSQSADPHWSAGFRRSFRLSDTIDRDKVSAQLKQGVLTLTLPKAEAAKPRQIQVQAG